MNMFISAVLSAGRCLRWPLSRLVALSLLPCALMWGSMPDLRAEPLPVAQEQRLMRILLQDCGSCHGLRMTGGLGPALTPHSLEKTPSENLLATILYGRPGTAMPPWSGLLSEREAAWMLDVLLRGKLP